MVVLTGDTHGQFNRVWDFCKKYTTNRGDIMVVLGDAGINFSGGARDAAVKRGLRNLPITLLCILLRDRSKMHYPEDFLIPKFK